MSRGPDAATQLERALVAMGAAAGCAPVLRAADWTRWASATFTGARHRIVLALPDSPVARRWLADLPEAEFGLGGHLVADLVLASQRRDSDGITVEIEVLTVELR